MRQRMTNRQTDVHGTISWEILKAEDIRNKVHGSTSEDQLPASVGNFIMIVNMKLCSEDLVWTFHRWIIVISNKVTVSNKFLITLLASPRIAQGLSRCGGGHCESALLQHCDIRASRKLPHADGRLREMLRLQGPQLGCGRSHWFLFPIIGGVLLGETRYRGRSWYGWEREREREREREGI
jgi:hypothetical protein